MLRGRRGRTAVSNQSAGNSVLESAFTVRQTTPCTKAPQMMKQHRRTVNDETASSNRSAALGTQPRSTRPAATDSLVYTRMNEWEYRSNLPE